MKHKTKKYTATDGLIHCINCKQSDYKASDRQCPKFRKECLRIIRLFPENNFCYFPIMDNPVTWGQVEQNIEASSNVAELI